MLTLKEIPPFVIFRKDLSTPVPILSTFGNDSRIQLNSKTYPKECFLGERGEMLQFKQGEKFEVIERSDSSIKTGH